MANKYNGEVEIKLGEETHILKYNWDAIGKIATKYGDDALQQLSVKPRPDIVAGILVIGLQGKHDMTVKKIMDISPPFISMITAIDQAVSLAYFGADGLEEIEESLDDKEIVSKDIKKKTL